MISRGCVGYFFNGEKRSTLNCESSSCTTPEMGRTFISMALTYKSLLTSWAMRSFSDYANYPPRFGLSIPGEPTQKKGDWKQTPEKRVKQRFSIHFTRLSLLRKRDFFVLSSRNEMRAGKFPYASRRDRSLPTQTWLPPLQCPTFTRRTPRYDDW